MFNIISIFLGKIAIKSLRMATLIQEKKCQRKKERSISLHQVIHRIIRPSPSNFSLPSFALSTFYFPVPIRRCWRHFSLSANQWKELSSLQWRYNPPVTFLTEVIRKILTLNVEKKRNSFFFLSMKERSGEKIRKKFKEKDSKHWKKRNRWRKETKIQGFGITFKI